MLNSTPELWDPWGIRLRDGDDSVLARVCLNDVPRLMRSFQARFCGRLQPRDAENAIQVALLRLWMTRGVFDPGRTTLSAWFRALALNAARDLIRNQRRRPKLVEPLRLDALPSTKKQKRTATAGQRADIADVSAALRKLPPRLVRVLTAGDGARDADPAEELHVRPATIRVYRHRGLQRLRSKIEAIRRGRGRGRGREGETERHNGPRVCVNL